MDHYRLWCLKPELMPEINRGEVFLIKYFKGRIWIKRVFFFLFIWEFYLSTAIWKPINFTKYENFIYFSIFNFNGKDQKFVCRLMFIYMRLSAVAIQIRYGNWQKFYHMNWLKVVFTFALICFIGVAVPCKFLAQLSLW